MSDVNAEKNELKAKLGIMELLNCGSDDVDWLVKFMSDFGVSLSQMGMYGTTFNEIVNGIYKSVLSFAGISEKLHNVKMVVDMSNSTMTIGNSDIKSLADIQSAAYSLGLSDKDKNSGVKQPSTEEIADLVVAKLTPKIQSIISSTFKTMLG